MLLTNEAVKMACHQSGGFGLGGWVVCFVLRVCFVSFDFGRVGGLVDRCQ